MAPPRGYHSFGSGPATPGQGSSTPGQEERARGLCASPRRPGYQGPEPPPPANRTHPPMLTYLERLLAGIGQRP